MKTRNLILSLILVCIGSAPSEAMKVPLLINHQALVSDAVGVPLNGSFDLTYRIYDGPVGGNLLWVETHSAVPVSNGIINVTLGSIDPLTPEIFSGSSDTGAVLIRFLEMQVGADPPITPMTRLVPAPYAVTAYRLAGDVQTLPGRLDVPPPDPLSGAEDISPAITLLADPIRPLEEVLADLADDQPAISLVATENENLMAVWSPGTIDTIPAIQLRCQITAAILTLRSILADVEPNEVYERGLQLSTDAFQTAIEMDWTPDDSIPAITMVANDSENVIRVWSPGTEGDIFLHPKITLSACIDGTSFGIENGKGDFGLELSTDEFRSAFKIDWSADDSVPAITMIANDSENVISVWAPGNGDNPNIVRSINLSACVEGTSFGLARSDDLWANNSDLADFGVQLKTDVFRSEIGVNWVPPPDGQASAINLVADSNKSFLALKFNDMAGTRNQPQMSMTTTASTCSLRVGWESPPVDNRPSFEVTTDLALSQMFLRGVEAAGGIQPCYRVASNTSSAELELTAGSAASPSSIILRTDGTEGRIGINVAGAPQSALDVVGNICVTGTVESCSDEKFKRNVHEIDDALDKISQLRGVVFEWKREEYAQMRFADGPQIGVIAQEVEAVLPELVNSPDGSYKTVDYTKLTAVLIEAVKELKAENEDLKKRMALLESR